MSGLATAIILGVLAVFFALVAPADSHPGRPLYPTDDHRVGVCFSLAAVIIAFAAGLSL